MCREIEPAGVFDNRLNTFCEWIKLPNNLFKLNLMIQCISRSDSFNSYLVFLLTNVGAKAFNC